MEESERWRENYGERENEKVYVCWVYSVEDAGVVQFYFGNSVLFSLSLSLSLSRSLSLSLSLLTFVSPPCRYPPVPE